MIPLRSAVRARTPVGFNSGICRLEAAASSRISGVRRRLSAGEDRKDRRASEPGHTAGRIDTRARGRARRGHTGDYVPLLVVECRTIRAIFVIVLDSGWWFVKAGAHWSGCGL